MAERKVDAGPSAGLSSNSEQTEVESETESEPFQSSGSEYVPNGPNSSSEDEPVEIVERQETSKAGVKKKKRDVKSWKRNVQKVKRAKGESYTSITSGKMIPERKQGTDCECHKECLTKLSSGEKNEILTAFNDLADQEKQDAYLSSLITVSQIKRRRKNVLNANNNSQRNNTYKYRVNF